jgi:ring-1,2-phenylacetyl-CoA epoxidase subunit PaaC
VNTITTDKSLTTYIVRHADDNVVLSQRLCEYISRAPDLEEDLAIANFALDHIGVAQHLFNYAAEVEGGETDPDALAMRRSEREFTNVLLVEQPHSDFADLIVRQFFFDAYQVPLWSALSGSTDSTISGIAQRAGREATYHLRHSSGWVGRLGDGTTESHDRMQTSIDRLWRYTDELFDSDEIDAEMARSRLGVDPTILKPQWQATIDSVLEKATLARPADPFQTRGGRKGIHTEYLGGLLAEMQWMQRAYPGLTW